MLLIRQWNLPVLWLKNMMNWLDHFSYHNVKCQTIERLHSNLAGADFRRAKEALLFSTPAPQWFPPSCVLFCYRQTFCPASFFKSLICLCPEHDTAKSSTLINNYGMRFCDSQNNQARVKDYQPKPKITLTKKTTKQKTKQKWKSCFCFFTDGKQPKAHKLDIITLRNHALQSI